MTVLIIVEGYPYLRCLATSEKGKERKKKKGTKEILGFEIVEVILGIRLRLKIICSQAKVDSAKVNLDKLCDRLKN